MISVKHAVPGALLVAAAILVAPVLAQVRAKPAAGRSVALPPPAEPAPPQPGWWTGHNEALGQYYVHPGYPRYDPHARYLGDLKGSWHDMGVQYGQRAGDLIRMVFEGYYDQITTAIQEPGRVVSDARLFGEYDSKLVPEAVEFMKGIAEGAAPELAKSTYANVGTPFEKILIVNHYYALRQVLGNQYTWGGSPHTTPSPYPVALRRSAAATFEGACTGVVVIGGLDSATKDRTTIHGGTRDQVFFPQLYEVSYTTSPADPKARRIWTISSAGEIGGQMAGNDQGVIVTGYAGGGKKELWAYGLEWNIGDWYAASFAKNAEEAATILTTGRPGFIEATGSKIVVVGWGINWLISDKKDARVVEIVPGRYAIRKIGDLGEENFLVCTNHCVATWSYDDENERTTVPMTDFGSEQGDYSGLSASGTRYWTQFWNAKYNHGSIDRDMVMEWYRGHYYIDKNGGRHDQVWDKERGWMPAHLKALTPCRHQTGSPDTMKGTTVDAKVGVAQDLAFYFTKGRPHDWVGPWDVLSLKYPMNLDFKYPEDPSMDRQHVLACRTLAFVFLLVVAPRVGWADQLPRFEKPILVTGTGQTPGSLTMMTFLGRLGIKATHDPMVVPSKMGGYKTMVVVMGASLKGLGAAGINQEEELDRDKMIFKKARELGMRVIAVHIEGTARRNAIADKFITPFVPQADFLLVFEEGNKDGLFTKLAAEHKVPLVVFRDFKEEFANIIKAIFP